jgi:hypothetical protein
MRQGFETAREGSAFGRPASAAIAALERVRAQGREAEIVDAATEAMEGLADSEAEAAGAAGEAVELGVELGDCAWRRRWGELGGFGGRGRWEGPGELELLGGRRSWDYGAGTPHDY